MHQAARHITFTGRVQGVGFRYTARSVAVRHNLTGYVRNCPDGSVEMLAQGAPADIDAAIRDIRENFGGYIRDIRTNEIPVDPRYGRFEITF